MGSGATKILREEAKKYEEYDKFDVDLNNKDKALSEVIRLRRMLYQNYNEDMMYHNLVVKRQNTDTNVKSDNVNKDNQIVAGENKKFHATEIINMNDEERAQHKKSVFEAAKKREKKRKRDMKKALKASDYSKSFSGTAEGTLTWRQLSEMLILTSTIQTNVTPIYAL